MLATVEINHDQHISFTQSRLTDAVSVILSELLSYEHPPNRQGYFFNITYFQIKDRGLPRFTFKTHCHAA
jgi:hypothetical protein